MELKDIRDLDDAIEFLKERGLDGEIHQIADIAVAVRFIKSLRLEAARARDWHGFNALSKRVYELQEEKRRLEAIVDKRIEEAMGDGT